MEIRPEEIASIIEKELGKYKTRLRMESVGSVIQVGDAIARIYGLDDVMLGEIVDFPNDVKGMVLNLEEDNVGAVIFGPDNPDRNIKEGDIVKRTGRIAQVPVGKALLGRVVSALGAPIDGKGKINADKYRPLEANAPTVVQRRPVDEPIETGIKAIDSMIPVGKGQRELIIGDRQTGKTALAIDTIINQKGKGVYCIYVAIGQKVSSVVGIAETLEKYGAMEWTTIVSASSRASATMNQPNYHSNAVIDKFLKLDYEPGIRECIFEPDKQSVISGLIPVYLRSKIKMALLEAFTAEHRMRAVAMGQATGNAVGLLEKLILSRNKARQADITGELLEIISSREALKG